MKEKNIVIHKGAQGFVIADPAWLIPVNEKGRVLFFLTKKSASL